MNERMRTTHGYNLHLINKTHCAPTGMPELPAVDTRPETLVGWNYARAATKPGAAAHFFLDDYQFESLWRDPERYVTRIENIGTLCTPDFSLYTDMPKPMHTWNVYRSRALGAFWGSLGATIIPTLQWATPDTYDTAFTGIEPGGTVAVTTIGTHRNPQARALWEQGMTAALKTINPTRVLLYGVPHQNFDWGNTEVVHYPTGMEERKAHGRKRISVTQPGAPTPRET